MFCVSSVDMLIKDYELFAKKKAEGKHKLKVATIFSYTLPDPDIVDLIERQMKVMERRSVRERVLEKVVYFVETVIRGIAA